MEARRAELETGIALRPGRVSLAVTLLWVALGIGVLRASIRFVRHADVRSVGIDELLRLALWASSVFFIVQLARGRAWARIAFLVILGLAVPLAIIPMFQSVTYFPISNGLGIVQVLIYAAAMFLVFQRDASVWFRSQSVPD